MPLKNCSFKQETLSILVFPCDSIMHILAVAFRSICINKSSEYQFLTFSLSAAVRFVWRLLLSIERNSETQPMYRHRMSVFVEMNERLLRAILISDCMLFLITNAIIRLWEPEATFQMCRRPFQNGFIVALPRIRSGTKIMRFNKNCSDNQIEE